jgi:predicted O-linked N-acetylglucosamine transferase (SPINDLY family)
MLHSALLRFPANASILIRYADALYQAGEVGQARETYRNALALEQGEFQAWYGCGMAEYSLGAYGAAVECLRGALELSPIDAEVHLYLGESLFHLGEITTAIHHLQLTADSGDSKLHLMAHQDIAAFIPGSLAHGNDLVLKARRAWATLEAKGVKPSHTYERASRSGQIRIGYVSSFFGDRNWMKAVWGLINQHDRSEFAIHLFADGSAPATASGYVKDARDFVHDITNLSNEEAAQRIGQAEIDILVDLNGYSAPERLGMFMRRPAPKLVSYFNMYATTGMPAFDYLIGDPVVIPVEEERFYTETVLRVSRCFVGLSVTYPVPMVAPPPSLRTRRITFGCLAPQYKLNSHVISAYAQILRAAPGTRLVFKSISLGESSNRRWLYEQFNRCGVVQDRIDAEGPAEHFEFLRTYDRIDIALDTFPYNGGTTTMEALWQGVPVLTFNGDRWSSRISGSLLLAAGLQEWVMPSVEMFVQRAIELATDNRTPTTLKELRAQMRHHLLRSAVCDTRMLCREIEQLYRTIVTTDCTRIG